MDGRNEELSFTSPHGLAGEKLKTVYHGRWRLAADDLKTRTRFRFPPERLSGTEPSPTASCRNARSCPSHVCGSSDADILIYRAVQGDQHVIPRPVKVPKAVRTRQFGQHWIEVARSSSAGVWLSLGI